MQKEEAMTPRSCASCDYQDKFEGNWALLFSPPENGCKVLKFHICPTCYTELLRHLEIVVPAADSSDGEKEKRNASKL